MSGLPPAMVARPWAAAEPAGEDPVRPVILGIILVGALLFVVGVLTFVHLQTQHIFKETAQLQISSGSIPRNDGGILFGSILTGLGPGLVLLALSPLTWKKRVAPFLVFMGATAAILVAHFSIYANGVIYSSRSALRLRASFLFSDANDAQSIAVFVLAGVTLVLLGIMLFAAMRLVTPRILEHHFRRPRDLPSHRTRLVLLTLVFLALGAGFLRQFLTYAISGDADPDAASARSALLTIYYLMSLSLLLLLGTVAIRVHSSVWGNLNDRRSPSYRRAHAYLLNSETWLWGVLLLLNLALAFFAPFYQPRTEVDRVFTVNSRGVSMFFVALTLGVYLGQRHASKAYMDHLMHNAQEATRTTKDRLWWLAFICVALWGGIAILTWSSSLSPLTQLILRAGAIALVIPFFAVRIDLDQLGAPLLRFKGAEQVLVFVALVSILTGIMLWGIGNSVTTVYSRSGGFVAPEDATLQPYAVGLRLLGSVFIAAPLTLTLWLVTSRHRSLSNPGPLLLSGLSIIAGMNLLLTVDPAGKYDSLIRQTDVLIGFRIVGLGGFDQAFVTILWCAVAAVGFLAFASLLSRGRDAGRRPGTSL